MLLTLSYGGQDVLQPRGLIEKCGLPMGVHGCILRTEIMPNQDKEFWDAHGRVGLVWSNPDASDDVLIAAALLKQPNFHLLLEIGSRFGLARLVRAWERVICEIEKGRCPEDLADLGRARPVVERFLRSMEEAVWQKS